MLFNFNLAPLERVQTWGAPGNPNLHWFGLTDGEYWIQAGAVALLEYSDVARAEAGCPRYCAYHVARLYEDVTQMLTQILEPVPDGLISYISGEGGARWDEILASWRADHGAAAEDEVFWDVADTAATWISQRTLDTGYLSPSSNIRFWSDTELVHIEWDNKDKLIEGLHAWKSLHGSAAFTREEFLREARAFHAALMSAMDERIGRVLAGALPRGVHVDLEELQREHAARSRPLDRELQPPGIPTDWERVLKAVRQIERQAHPAD